MDVDYKELCRECFGTTDVNELRQIAAGLHKSNPRNAGRKPKFNAAEIKKMQQMRQSGSTMTDIAAQFHTSRQIVDRYLNEKPQPGCSLRMTLMYKTRPCTVIDVNFLNRQIKIENRTEDPLHRAFGYVEKPDWDDFECFLQDRCFPPTRGNAKELLKTMGVPGYDPLAIIEKTKGRTADDSLWIKFDYFDKGSKVKNAG